MPSGEVRLREPRPSGNCYLSFQKMTNTVKIEDIRVDSRFENRGVGSLLLAFAESWAREHGASRMVGDLSDVDASHFDKLKHFYEKHGFTFRLLTSQAVGTRVGDIEKSLVPL
jgi:GNAT superfamily N-acetyltransferase